MQKTASWLCLGFITFAIINCLTGCSSSAVSAKGISNLFPGKYDDYVLLPNGWKLTPVGDQIDIGELPLNSVVTKDERYLIVSNSGTKENSLSVIDIAAKKEIQRLIIDKTWRGLAFNGDESTLYVSGGNNNSVVSYSFREGKLAFADSFKIAQKYPKGKISVTGVEYCKKKNALLVVSKESNSLYVIDAASKEIIKTLPLGGECFDVKINKSGKYAYVAIWDKAQIAEISLNDFSVSSVIKVGDHPCEMLVSADDSKLYVADANNNTVSVVDLKNKKEIERLNSALSPEAPFGSTPNALCFNADESVLYVANADNNYIAVFDISQPGKSKSIGFIPVGWYPVSVKFLQKSGKMIAVNAKGVKSLANPEGPVPTKKKSESSYDQYIAHLFKGTVSVFDVPGKEQLALLSKKVYNNTPYASKEKITSSAQSVIPFEHNGKGSSKIKYVFYVIKENRTYDQVYGDIKKGNGDSSLCIFGEQVTPNQHLIAENFALFDNYYADAEVSADGHNWSTAAYASDYVEKTWPVFYGGRGGTYDYEGGVPIAAPSSGYIWDAVIKKGLTPRSYGEFVEETNDPKSPYRARNENMRKYTSTTYPCFDLSISDLYRYKKFCEEFDGFEKTNTLPQFNLISLPNNHTSGTKAGTLTPKAYVAQNDYALGLMVEKISRSKYWKETAIFVLEDDAQNGADHIDAHRSCLLVISPYIKNNTVDHNMYSTSSVLKTMELILGLPPMTQFDLSANPILLPFTDTANVKEYKAVQPKIDIEEKNMADAYGAKRCEEFDLTKEDAIPDIEFNEIIWKSVKGKASEMPAPVRSAFVNVSSHQQDDDDD